jgi:hypothetical protein
MKLDKDTFVKHHFWFLLALLFPLIFLAMIMLWTSTASAIAEQQAKYEGAVKKVAGLPGQGPKNIKWIEALSKKESKVEAQRATIWKDAWAGQAELMTWPEGLAKLKDLYFGDKIPQADRSVYTHQDQYFTQLDDIIALVEPVNEKGDGVVQCPPDRKWEDFIEHVQEWKNETPPSEEIWLAQEDLWLQRELLRMVRDANDSVAIMKEVQEPAPSKPDRAKGERDHRVYANPNWKMDIVLAEDAGKPVVRFRITNASDRRQSLGVGFQVSFKDQQATELAWLDGEPLPPGKFIDKEQPLAAQVGIPDALEGVKQVFDWRTAPVKRVVRLDLGYHSQRTAYRGLKAYPFPQLKDEKREVAPGVPAEAAPQAASAPPSQTLNGLRPYRYSEITPEVRRVPVGMVLIVDQKNLQDVLTAVSNSRLRMQITQWEWVRHHDDVKPKVDPNAVPPRPARTTKGPARPTRAARPAGAGASAVEDRELELVQLAVYGIASLYERYPPPKPPAAPAPAAAAAAPAAGAPAVPAPAPKSTDVP